jgi:hypothetical protein
MSGVLPTSSVLPKLTTPMEPVLNSARRGQSAVNLGRQAPERVERESSGGSVSWSTAGLAPA